VLNRRYQNRANGRRSPSILNVVIFAQYQHIDPDATLFRGTLLRDATAPPPRRRSFASGRRAMI
jgi:hypothetical protein